MSPKVLTTRGSLQVSNGIHLIDRTCWLLNEIPETVYARMTFHPHYPGIETSVSAVLSFASGRTATILMAMMANGPKEEGEILGTQGTLRYSAFRGMQRTDGKTVTEVKPTISGDARARQLQEFAASIKEQRSPSVPGEWGRDMVRINKAAYESYRLGAPVHLSSNTSKGVAQAG